LLRLGEARKEKAGNPDWVTDLELLRFISDPDINPQGSAARGFRTSIKQTLPNVLTCLREIHRLKNGPPRSIYVTGHSLGGALAVDFASAVLLGTRYGPDGLGQSMPDEIKIWPWRATRVMTFGSPAVGDVNFQKAFDEVVLCNRVWVYKDVVTLQFSDSVVGLPLPGSVVGEGHHLKPGIGHNVGPMEAHDPRFIRRFLVRHRKSKGADLTGTPANTGKEELSEPWKVFDSCLGAFNHMKAALDSYVLNTPSFKDLVLAFDVECARYVWAVEDALAALKDPQLQQKLQILSELWKYFHDPDPDPTAPPAMRILKLHTLWDDVAKANLLPDYKGSTENGVKSRFSRFVGLLLFTSAVGRDPGLLKHMSTSGGPEKLAFMNLVNSKF
jgi:Lipase (class 3)